MASRRNDKLHADPMTLAGFPSVRLRTDVTSKCKNNNDNNNNKKRNQVPCGTFKSVDSFSSPPSQLKLESAHCTESTQGRPQNSCQRQKSEEERRERRNESGEHVSHVTGRWHLGSTWAFNAQRGCGRSRRGGKSRNLGIGC